MRIRDPGWKKVRSGIRDKHPGSATLPVVYPSGSAAYLSGPAAYAARFTIFLPFLYPILPILQEILFTLQPTLLPLPSSCVSCSLSCPSFSKSCSPCSLSFWPCSLSFWSCSLCCLLYHLSTFPVSYPANPSGPAAYVARSTIFLPFPYPILPIPLQCSGSGIRDWVLFDPGIRNRFFPDPGFRISDPGSWIPRPYF